MREMYIIECRDANGKLDFSGRQPEVVFGNLTLRIDVDTMARIIFRKCDCLGIDPDSVHLGGLAAVGMHGTNIPQWPSLIDPRWSARIKTW